MGSHLPLEGLRSEDQLILACLQQQPVLPDLAVDETLLLHRLAYHRVTATVCHYLLQTQQFDRFSEPTQIALKAHYHHNIIRNLAIEHLLKEISRTLAAQNIQVMVLKGAMFLHEFPGYDLIREMTDLDIMVKPQQFYRALAVLAELQLEDHEDFRTQRYTLRNWYRQQVDNALRLYCENRLHADIVVELHWQLFSRTVNFTHWSMRSLWQRSRHCLGQGVYHLDCIDVLLHLCVHQCTNFSIYLYGLVDVSHVLKLWGDQLDWDELIDRAQRQGILLHLVNILRLCHELLQVPLPSVYERSLQRYESQAESGYVFLRHWLLHQEMNSDETGEYLPQLRAFRQLEPFSLFDWVRQITPRSARQFLRQLLSES